ncbi:protein of unknown function [Limnospira indica PCC 8005]|uniref:Uncharacterized protein n=1 Tax=Limnospira indica PCC 8005 TaxID=376219 RepID=A0A9P1KAH5_9CYAN|nr:protein of unknown function [Limnospira indica PCC 8005]
MSDRIVGVPHIAAIPYYEKTKFKKLDFFEKLGFWKQAFAQRVRSTYRIVEVPRIA